ncbi:MAG TPA: hypothetical protein VM537_00415 [Anaerolineae bacterium]|nr:hypothetical protein [Anaerolineae bacterium]
MDNVLLFGVELAVVLKRLVNFIKSLTGIEGKAVQLLVVGLAVVFLAANEAALLYPIVAIWWERLFTIVFVAVGAAEVYELRRDLSA